MRGAGPDDFKRFMELQDSANWPDPTPGTESVRYVEGTKDLTEGVYTGSVYKGAAMDDEHYVGTKYREPHSLFIHHIPSNRTAIVDSADAYEKGQKNAFKVARRHLKSGIVNFKGEN